MKKFKDIGHAPVQGLRVQSNEGEQSWRKEMAQAIEKKRFNDSIIKILEEIAQDIEKQGALPRPHPGSCNIKTLMRLDEPVLKYTFGTTLHFPYESME